MSEPRTTLARVTAALRHERADATFKNGSTVRSLRSLIAARDPSDRRVATDFNDELTATPAEKIRVLHETFSAEDPRAVFRSNVRMDSLVTALAAEMADA